MLCSGFSSECKNVLAVSGLNASSLWDKNDEKHRISWSSTNTDSGPEFLHWAADANDPHPWVELGLGEKSTITGRVETLCARVTCKALMNAHNTCTESS